jgi:hypothetical protein
MAHILDVLDIILICFNLIIFLLVWRIFWCIAFIHDMVKFFILDKILLKGVKR